MNKFGKSEDMSRVVLQQASKENALADVMVSFVNQPQFSEFKIPKSTKNNIERYFVLTKKSSKDSTEEVYSNISIVRKLFNVVLTDETWANYSFSSIMKAHDKLLMACKSY
jgi:pantothenate synthetase